MSPLKSYDSQFSVKRPAAYDATATAHPETVKEQDEKPVLPELAPAHTTVQEEGVEPTPSRIAVFVVHGMGQQIPFETLDIVTAGLRAAEAESRRVELDDLEPPAVRQVAMDGEVQRRVELTVEGPNGPREVHIYEAYWAPKTEGKLTLRDVMSFLTGAAVNGMANCLKPFRRWMFNRQFEFPRSFLRLFVLLGALAVLLSLGAMNGTIATIAVAKASHVGPQWLTPELFKDLTMVAGLFCLCGVCFGAALVLALFRKAAVGGRHWSLPAFSRWALWIFFFVTCLTTIGTTFEMGALIRIHIRIPRKPVLEVYLGAPERILDLANIVTAACVLALLAAMLGWAVKSWAHRSFENPPAWPGFILSGLFYLTLIDFLLAAVAVVTLFAHRPVPGAGFISLFGFLGARWELWVWALLIGVSSQVRKFLIQYVGDVAAYISPSKLDRFDQIRDEIKALVLKVAQKIYAAKDDHGNWQYGGVAVVGHSLGSVIIYDTLNHLINDDLLHITNLGVGKRTRLLLTFGSPLDKIAYMFAAQGNRTSETREVLSAAVQPLIQSYALRTFPWVNVHSKSDIFSGPLDFYDDDTGNAMKVKNREDPGASIPLAAHTEYWKGREIWSHLYASVV